MFECFQNDMWMEYGLKIGWKLLLPLESYEFSSVIFLLLFIWVPWVIKGCSFVDNVYWSWLVACFLPLFPLFLALSFPPISIDIYRSLSALFWLFLNIDDSDKFAKWLNCDSKFLTCLTFPIPEISCFVFVWLPKF